MRGDAYRSVSRKLLAKALGAQVASSRAVRLSRGIRPSRRLSSMLSKRSSAGRVTDRSTSTGAGDVTMVSQSAT
eukprot:1341411-Prymnesium_polylepis.1